MLLWFLLLGIFGNKTILPYITKVFLYLYKILVQCNSVPIISSFWEVKLYYHIYQKYFYIYIKFWYSVIRILLLAYFGKKNFSTIYIDGISNLCKNSNTINPQFNNNFLIFERKIRPLRSLSPN
jgi:hypothetical protein